MASRLRSSYQLRLILGPCSGELIDRTRLMAEVFCRDSGTGDELAAAAAMATHELLENASRYGSAPEVELVLSVDHKADRLTVRLSNPSSREHISHLKSIAARMRKHTDAMAHFMVAIEQPPRRPGGSGLGLARIWSEGRLDLRITTRGNRVRISATAEMKSARYSPRRLSRSAPP